LRSAHLQRAACVCEKQCGYTLAGKSPYLDPGLGLTASATEAIGLAIPDKLLAFAEEVARVQSEERALVTKVLYVEHDDDNVYMLKTRLELLGDFEVLAARDSESGCELAVTEHPDVILMDLEMPVVDRWEPVRRLKNDPHTHDIPIIGMSAHSLEAEREHAIAAGCDEFDAKPIEFDSLVATIRRVLAHPK
jgi:two-component system cell cycle response regulator DivK